MTPPRAPVKRGQAPAAGNPAEDMRYGFASMRLAVADSGQRWFRLSCAPPADGRTPLRHPAVARPGDSSTNFLRA